MTEMLAIIDSLGRWMGGCALVFLAIYCGIWFRQGKAAAQEFIRFPSTGPAAGSSGKPRTIGRQRSTGDSRPSLARARAGTRDSRAREEPNLGGSQLESRWRVRPGWMTTPVEDARSANLHTIRVLAAYTVIREAWRDDWTGKGLRLAHGTSQQLPRVFVRWVR